MMRMMTKRRRKKKNKFYPEEDIEELPVILYKETFVLLEQVSMNIEDSFTLFFYFFLS